MFAYIDESGNTGTKILDNKQPHFWYLVLMKRFNFNERYNLEFTKIAMRQGCDYIHASASSPADNDYFCANVLRLLKNEEFGFGVVLVEKRAHAATLFYDYFFESNPGLPIYQAMVQSIWRAAICELLDDTSQDLFWHKCVNANEDKASESAMIELCRYFINRLDLEPEIKNRIDPRLKELFSDCLGWAEANPKEYSMFIKRKTDRLKNSPPIMSYVELLIMIRDQMDYWGEDTCFVTHDNSEQFEKAIKETHLAVCPDIPLEFSLSRENAGLQLCDLFLSVVRRDAMEMPISHSQKELHDFVYMREERQYFLLTQRTLQDEAALTQAKINALPVSAADMKKGWQHVEKENKRRLRRIKRN